MEELGYTPEAFLELTPFSFYHLRYAKQLESAHKWDRARWLGSIIGSFSLSGKAWKPTDLMRIPMLDKTNEPSQRLSDEEFKSIVEKLL